VSRPLDAPAAPAPFGGELADQEPGPLGDLTGVPWALAQREVAVHEVELPLHVSSLAAVENR
jgi:hypothetical protein